MKRGGRTIRFLGRKGMSPLIATVLLMAFAVALGGMIMNWSSSPGTGGECDSIQIRVGKMCAQDDKILLSMRNTPESVGLVGVNLQITQNGFKSVAYIKDSTLAPGQPLEVTVPAAVDETSTVDILGMIGSVANPVTCSNPIATADPIKPCE